MTTSPSVPIYAALDGWRRYMVRSGREVLGRGLELARTVRRSVDEIDGLTVTHDELLREEASHDLDEMQVLIDVDGLGVSGYQCADWLREHHCVDLGLSDHRRILATISHADDEDTADRLLTALRDLASAADSFDPPREIRQPSPDELQLENRMLPPVTPSSATPSRSPSTRLRDVLQPNRSHRTRPVSRWWYPARC